LMRGQQDFTKDKPYYNRHGAAFRAIYDFSDLDKSIFIQSTGQSGNFLSGHYSDFSEKWARQEFLPMTTQAQDYSKDATGTWKFLPD